MDESATSGLDRQSELRHLLRSVKTALELAVVARVPPDLLTCLARPAGLLEAISQLPPDAPSVDALVPGVVSEARAALERWERWTKRRGPAA